MKTYDYVFFFKGRQIEIVTDTIADALEHLRFTEPSLQLTDLSYFVDMTTGVKTPAFDKREIFLDEIQKLVKV